MGVTDKIRQAFDECTVMAGVKNDFECVYITKAAALLYLNEIDDENAKLRELVKKLVILAFARCANCDLLDASCALVPTQKCLLWNECESIARELGVEVDDG